MLVLPHGKDQDWHRPQHTGVQPGAKTNNLQNSMTKPESPRGIGQCPKSKHQYKVTQCQ